MPEDKHPIDPQVCVDRFERMEKSLEIINQKVGSINARLFESNGLSYSTRLVLVEEGHKKLEKSFEDSLVTQSKYKDMATSAFINLLVTSVVIGIGALTLWQSGMFGK